MRSHTSRVLLCWLSLSGATLARAQVTEVDPQLRTRNNSERRVGVVEVGAHFVTAIHLPEVVNSVVVGDPILFQVEHSEHEPQLVFIKPLTTARAETNLLISTAHGNHISLLVVTRGVVAGRAKIDFLVQYKSPVGFLIEPEAVPFPLVGQTTTIAKSQPTTAAHGSVTENPTLIGTSIWSAPGANVGVRSPATLGQSKPESLEDLLQRQSKAPLPALYGQRIHDENVKADRLRAGISEVIDGGQQVIVLFSVVNTGKHAILLMPPQVQLGGKSKTGKLVKQDRWSTAEQLAVMDFRLSRRRVAPGERADGVVVFERPPYKQSNETLFLQMAESGAVDRPALAPIGFGVSSLREDHGYGTHGPAN